MAKISDYLTVGVAAEYLDVHPDSLRRWDRVGKLTARRHPVSRYRLYVRKELDAVLGQVNEMEKANGPSCRTKRKGAKRKQK